MTVPVLASSNRAQARYLLEGAYPTNFGDTITGNGTNLNMTSETFSFEQKYAMSKNIRSDRSPAGHTLVSASAAGAFNVEHQYKEFDPFYEGVMGSQFVVYGTNGVSAAITTLTLASGTITAGAAPTGADAFTTLNKGQWFLVIPPSGATAPIKEYFRRRAFRVSLTTAPTTTVITLDANTPINTTIATTTMSGGKIASSRVYTGTSLWSYNIEIAQEDINVFRLYRGQVPGKINWKLTVGEIVTGSIEFMGKDMADLATSTYMGTPNAVTAYGQANATKGVFDIIEGTASISATTYIKSADITIDGSLRMQDAVGVLGAAGIAPGTFKVGGTLEVYFANKTLYEKFLLGNKSSMSIPILDNDGNGYVYYFPYVTYTAAKVNATGQDQDTMLSMTFECDYDPTVGSDTLNKVCAIYRVGVAV